MPLKDAGVQNHEIDQPNSAVAMTSMTKNLQVQSPDKVGGVAAQKDTITTRTELTGLIREENDSDTSV